MTVAVLCITPYIHTIHKYGYTSDKRGTFMSDLELWKKAKTELEQARQQGTITYACVCGKIRELTIKARAMEKIASKIA